MKHEFVMLWRFFPVTLLIVVLICFIPQEGNTSSTLLINEFLASSYTFSYDDSGDTSDWIEIYNPTKQAIDLAGYYISDNPKKPLKWQIPSGHGKSTIVPAQGYCLLIANGKPEDGPLYLNFELSKNGESIILTAPDGVQVIDQVTFGSQWYDTSYGRSPKNPNQWVFIMYPTPGKANESRVFSSYWIAGLHLFYRLYIWLFFAVLIFLAILILACIYLLLTWKKYKQIEEKQSSLIRAVPEIIIQLDHYGKITWMNQVGVDCFGNGIIGKPSTEALFISTNHHSHQLLQNLYKNRNQVLQLETRSLKKNGEQIIVQWNMKACSLWGKANGAIMVGRDITQQRNYEEQIKANEKIYRDIFENTPVGILKCDLSGNILDVNERMLAILGSPGKEKTKEINLLNDPDIIASGMHDQLALLKENQIVTGECKYTSKWGKTFWLQYKIYPVLDETGNVHEVIITGDDATERKKVEEKLQYLSLHDSLTDLYNRAFYEEELKRLNTDRQYPLSIIVGDINGLKMVNDAFGHQEGDILLQNIAAVLKKCCRKEDIIARWGGDEFGIILPQTDYQTTLHVCSRIRIECDQWKSDPIPMSISLGVATKTDPTQDLNMVIGKAEEKMYEEKSKQTSAYQRMILSSFIGNLKEKTRHSSYLAEIAIWFGKAVDLPYSEEDLHFLVNLHDLGKINLDHNLLSKSGSLTPEEWERMKKHPEIGYRIARSIPNISSIAEAIWAHHERWDGTGYPRGLSGNDIPLLARIMAIIDAFDTMMCGRPYKPAMSKEEAINEIAHSAGTQFDPDLAMLFIEKCPVISKIPFKLE